MLSSWEPGRFLVLLLVAPMEVIVGVLMQIYQRDLWEITVS